MVTKLGPGYRGEIYAAAPDGLTHGHIAVAVLSLDALIQIHAALGRFIETQARIVIPVGMPNARPGN
jgi:hypothetical protein